MLQKDVVCNLFIEFIDKSDDLTVLMMYMSMQIYDFKLLKMENF